MTTDVHWLIIIQIGHSFLIEDMINGQGFKEYLYFA